MPNSHGGRPSSWAGVGVVFLGFVVGGSALIAGTNWIAFWIGVAIVAAGVVFLFAVGVFSDVVLAEPVRPGGDDPDMSPNPVEEATGRPTRREASDLPHG